MIIYQIEDYINEKARILWINTYKDLCDEVINGIYIRKNTEIDWMNKEQKEAWYSMPSELRKSIDDMVRSFYDSSIYMSRPYGCKNLLKRYEFLSEKRQKLVETLRKYRDNGDAELVYNISNTIDENKWNILDPEIKIKIKNCWIELAKITIPLNQCIFFTESNSPEYWKYQTKNWLMEYKLV
jgi:hypothetical protein